MSRRPNQLHAQVQKMLDKDGIYVCTDTKNDCQLVFISTRGHLIACAPAQEVDPAELPATLVAHGPYPEKL